MGGEKMNEVYCSVCGRMYENDEVMRFFKNKDKVAICEECLRKTLNFNKELAKQANKSNKQQISIRVSKKLECSEGANKCI